MARLILFCILLFVVLAYLDKTNAENTLSVKAEVAGTETSRIARSPQYRRPYGLPPPPPPPPRGFGPGYDPYERFDRGPGRYDHGPGRFDHGHERFSHGHHGYGHHDRDKYDIPPGSSISISKTISISSGGNAQSSASSSAGSGTNAGPGGSSASSNAESSASGK